MNNFKSSGPGGLRKRPEFMGGRPKSDANYGAKKSFDRKPFGGGDRGGSRGGSRDGDRGSDRGGFQGNRGGERRQVEMHKATCSTCGKPCEVPFRPDGSKPVLCSECFGKNRSDDRNGVERRDSYSNDHGPRKPERTFDTPRPDRGPSPDFKALTEQIKVLESKMHEVLELLKETPKKAPAKAVVEEIATEVTPAKVRKPKKETVAKKVVKKATKKAAKKVAKKK
jgi:CxxC-x17-CxxC domain-containing protein